MAYLLRYMAYVTDQNGLESDYEVVNPINEDDEMRAKAIAFDNLMGESDVENQNEGFFDTMEGDGLNVDGPMQITVKVIEFSQKV